MNIYSPRVVVTVTVPGCSRAANKTQSKFIEHHSCPMHDDSTAPHDRHLGGLDLVDEHLDAPTADVTRRRFRLPSERRHYSPTRKQHSDEASAASRRRTGRWPPDAADGPASLFLLLLVVACILLMMLVVGSLSYCVAVRSD